MSHSHFLVRTALLDPGRKVVAHEVAWQRNGAAAPDDALPLLLASALQDAEKGWLLADGHLIVPLAPAALACLTSSLLPPAAVTIAIDAAALDGADGAAIAEELRRRGFGLALREADASSINPAAIIRGRFAELLGMSLLPTNEAENLFVAGMFSMLDRLLGMPMEEVLTQIPLSEALCQALLSRDGMYGPFLALAESCERSDGGCAALADALFLSADQVNRAHLAALAWEQNLKL